MSLHKHNFNPSEVERLLHHLPTVASMTSDAWLQGFAKSVIKQSRRKNWQPSTKQMSVMRKVVADLFAENSNEEGEIDVIE